jgi:kynurenine formamidase
VRWLVVYAAVFQALFLVTRIYEQPALDAVGVPVAGFGLLYAAFKLVSAGAAATAGPLHDRLGARGVFLGMAPVYALAYAAILLHPVLVVPALFVNRGLTTVAAPVRNQYLNDRLADVGRATVLSGASMVLALVGAGRTVTLVSRHPLRCAEFDSEPCYAGPLCMRPFSAIRDLRRRRRLIRDARRPGTLPPDLHARLGAAVAQDDKTVPESPWGPDDQIGAANHLSAKKVLEAAELIESGKAYSLGVELNRDFPAYGSRFFDITVVESIPAGNAVGPNKLTANDDVLHTWVGIGSQIDGFGHIGIDHVHYNNNNAGEIVDTAGLKRLGLENLPPIVTRGVLLDMTAHFEKDMLAEGTAFNSKEIRAAAKAQGVEIRKGDVVLFHTGWLNLVGEDNERFAQAEPGLGVDGAQYLAEQGVVAVGADTWGLEVIPFEENRGPYEVHQTLLTKHGVYILENMDTRELVGDGVSEFLFVLGQPKVKGSVQMIINPVAIR